MKFSSLKSKLIIGVSFIPFIFIILAIIYLRVNTLNYLEGRVDFLQDGWEYLWVDADHPSEIPAELSWEPVSWGFGFFTKKNDYLWIKRQASDIEVPQPVILISGVMEQFECFLNSKKLYQSGSMDKLKQKDYHNSDIMTWHVFDVPENYQDKTIYLRLYSTQPWDIGILNGFIYFANKSEYIGYFFLKNIPLLAPGFFYLIFGVLSFLLFLIRYGQNTHYIIFFSLFCICMGIAFIFAAPIIQLVSSVPELHYYMVSFALFFFPAALFAFFRAIIPVHQKIFGFFWKAHLVGGTAAIFADLFLGISAFSFLPYHIALVMCGLAVTGLMVFYGAFKHRGESIILAIGTGVMVASGLIEILVMKIGIEAFNEIGSFQFGSMIFVISLFYILEDRYQKIQKKLKQNAEALEEKNVQLENYGKNLEHMVTERTDELNQRNADLKRTLDELNSANTKLVQSAKMASLGNLAAGIAHEVNNPIGAVNSAADVVNRCRKILDDGLKNYKTTAQFFADAKIQKALKLLAENTDVISIAGQRVSTIVRSLKNFARLDESSFQCIDIHEGIDSTLTLVQHEFKNRITVEKNYSVLPAIDCYPNELNQVFMNLFINAAQAIEDQGIVKISTRKADDNIEIEIADSGSGIAPADLDKIYDPGFTTKSRGVGTGLGLSISYNIIEKHHGKISVQSMPGKGTVFTIILPLRQA